MVQSPKSDIYVVMLGIALGAILLSTLLLIIVFSRYNFSTKTASRTGEFSVTSLA